MTFENSPAQNLLRSAVSETAFARAETSAAKTSLQDAKQRQKIAQEFSSFLYLEVLKAMRAASVQHDDADGEALPRDLYSSMMDAEVARLAAQRDASGFVKAVEKSLESVSVTAKPAVENKKTIAEPSATDGNLAPLPQAPVSGVISSPFGLRADPFTGTAKFHHGVDIAAPAGSPVKAAASGRVIFSGVAAGYGNLVEIDHGAGIVTRYGHNAANLVSVGDKIAAGQSVALVGQTGRATGDHLHFEVRHDGKAVSPELFLGAAMKGMRLRSRA